MGTHESTVNFQNLIRDLADMYPFEVAEVVVVELVANSLDAGATQILIDYNPKAKVLVVADNGKGMTAAQFEEYHDFAAGLKTRGAGIGFAGLGAKISFNIADRVETETRSDVFSGGSDWYLQSKKKLVWDDISPARLQGKGTRVEVRILQEFTPPYATTEDLIQLLRRHYLPLFDVNFLALYEALGYYSAGLRIAVNGQAIEPHNMTEVLNLDHVKHYFPTRAGRRIGYGVFGLAASEYPLGSELVGVILCTHGKVIKGDLFNQFPGSLGPRLLGLAEIPGFVDFVTTAKTDFIRGRRHKQFEGLYGPVREAFKAWLAALGVKSQDQGDPDEAAKLERELRKLVDAIPELADFFGFRTRKPVLQQRDAGLVGAVAEEGVEGTFPTGEGTGGGGPGLVDVGDAAGEALVERQDRATKTADPVTRTARRGPRIGFAEAPDRVDLAWVDGNYVTINSGHPSYRKSLSNPRANRLQCMFAIATAIYRYNGEGTQPQHMFFIDRMMKAWGES